MQKSVQITRTISFDEVPGHVSDMMIESKEIFDSALENNFHELEILIGQKNFTTFLENLETFRVELAKADMILEDCRNIVSGYADLILNPEAQQQQGPPQQDHPYAQKANMPNIDMEKMLSDWKENLSGHVKEMQENTKSDK